MTYPSKAQIVAEADSIDEWLDDVAQRLAQWVADGGVVDTGLLAEVLDDVLVARNILAVLRLRAVQS